MKSEITVFVAAILILVFSASVSTVVSGADAEEGKTVSLDTQNTDIRELLSGLAKANGINLVIGDSVKGNVTMSLSGVSPTEAIDLILVSSGFAMEKVGNSIIAGTPEEIRKFLPSSSEVIILEYASATELSKSLSGVVPSEVQIQADPRTNSIIVKGPDFGVQKLKQIIGLLDVDVPAKAETIIATKAFALKYAQASKLEKVISELATPEGKVSMEDATNSLVVIDEASRVEQISKVIMLLDAEDLLIAREKPMEEEKPQPPPELRTRIFSLSHIDANAIEDILKEMLSPRGKIQTFVRYRESIPPIKTTVMGDFGTDLGGSALASGGDGEGKWSDTLIVSDEDRVLSDIEELIKQLDTMALQVKIEARVVEVNLSDAVDLGMEWEAVHSPSGSGVEGRFPVSKATGIFLRTGTFSSEYFEDMLARLQVLETRGKAKIMFNPSVMTLDNEAAQMLVADKIPITRTYETEFRATTGFEFISVGISLTVIPHITEDGYIIMDTMPQVDSIKEWTTGENPQPIISSRVAHTRVRVKDGETFAIGGLIKEEHGDSKSGVPFLCRIPLLGRLFGSTNSTSSKTDLIVFITPVVYRENP